MSLILFPFLPRVIKDGSFHLSNAGVIEIRLAWVGSTESFGTLDVEVGLWSQFDELTPSQSGLPLQIKQNS